MIAGILTQKIGEAMKARDEVRLSTLRMLSSALSYEKIAKQHELTSEEELVVIRKEAKKRVDAIEAYEKAGSKDRAEKEEAELLILKEYLPAEMEESELIKLVETALTETGATQMKDMGRVIGLVVAKSGGRVEGGRVSALVKQKLS